MIIKDKINKYYIWLIDTDISIFFERECILKHILYKDNRRNPKILFNNIKNAITLYKIKKEQKKLEQKKLEQKKLEQKKIRTKKIRTKKIRRGRRRRTI